MSCDGNRGRSFTRSWLGASGGRIMGSKIISAVRAFRWPQWLVVGLFLLLVGFTVTKTVHTIRHLGHWRVHRDEPIRGWMTIGYVAHSYHVPQHVLYEALGLPDKPHDKRPLRAIAKAQHRSMDEVRTLLQDAILHTRPPPPPPNRAPNQAPSPPPSDRGGAR